jgi:phage repressor protein C with HTH and peptisase S24 domain
MGIKKENSETSAFQLGVAKRLRDAFDSHNLTGAALSKASPFASSTLNNWLNGKSSPSAEFLAHIQNLGLDVPYILSGHRSQPTTLELVNKISEASPTPYKRSLSGSAPSPAEGDSEDTVFIDLLSATGSMGPGNDVLTEDVVMGRVPFSRRWLSQHLPRSRPQALKLVHAYGDSMKGTLESGDFGIVDTDLQTPDVDGVYVLQAHNRLFIKRVTQRLDGTHVVSSDNPLVTQTDVLNGFHEVRVCGRVVYGWNGRRL